MVRRGEYLERAVVLPGEPALEGLYHRGRSAPSILFAPAHPARGGGMESPVIAELAWRLTRAGHPTLRFNYPGVGASAGAFSREGAHAALARAVEHLEASAPGPVAAVGVGLGGILWLERAATAPLVWVMPDPEAEWPPAAEHGAEVTVVLAEQTPADLRARVEAWAAEGPRATVRWVPGADPWYRRNLVTLGRVVLEVFEPPGLVALPEGDDDFLE